MKGHKPWQSIWMVLLAIVAPVAAEEVRVADAAALVTAVAAAGEGDVVVLAGGTYELTAPLKVGGGVTLRGGGAGVTTLRNAAGWTSSFDNRPDNELKISSADRGGYLIDLGDNHSGIRIQAMTLTAPELHGGVIGHGCRDLELSGLELREFGWCGVRLFSTRAALIRDNTFTDAAGRVSKTTGGAIFASYLEDSEITNNRFTKTQAERKVFGIKGRQFRNVHIHHNTIAVNFSIELPFENDHGIEIDHNYLGGVVSIPKHGGGITKLDGAPIEAGQAFHIHHNIFTTSYAIEGPRNGTRIDHNLFVFRVDDDGGNLISIFGSDYKGVIPGPLVFEQNLVRNPGRGVFWSDLPHDGLTFAHNEVVADETTPSEHPDGLLGLRGSKGKAATDMTTVRVMHNLFRVLGKARPLLRGGNQPLPRLANNRFENLSDTTGYPNPPAEEAPGLTEPLRFTAGVDGEYEVDGWEVTEPSKAAATQPSEK